MTAGFVRSSLVAGIRGDISATAESMYRSSAVGDDDNEEETDEEDAGYGAADASMSKEPPPTDNMGAADPSE
jgi:hypothetical protein